MSEMYNGGRSGHLESAAHGVCLGFSISAAHGVSIHHISISYWVALWRIDSMEHLV